MIRSEPNQFQLQKVVCFQLWRRQYLNEICAAGTILLECSVQRSVSVTIKILNDVAPESAHCCSLSAGCQSGAGAALIAAEMLCYYQLCMMRLIVWSGGDNIEIKAHKLLLYGTNFYVLDGIEIFSMLCNVFEMCLNPMTLLKHLYSPFVIPLCNVRAGAGGCPVPGSRYSTLVTRCPPWLRLLLSDYDHCNGWTFSPKYSDIKLSSHFRPF